MATKATQQDINTVSRVAREIAAFPELYSVIPETYYSNAGDPGRLVRASRWVDAYVQLNLGSGSFEVWVKDLSTGTETGKTLSCAADAITWAKDEIAARVGTLSERPV